MEGILSEKEMRLLVGIVLDAADEARNTKVEENSLEMKQSCEIVSLANKLVKIVNEMYPVKDTSEKSIFAN